MRQHILAGLLLVTPLQSEELDTHKKEGELYAKKNKDCMIEKMKDFSIEEIKSKNCSEFNSDSSEGQLKRGEISEGESEVLTFLRSEAHLKNVRENGQFSNEDYFIKRSDDIIEGHHDESDERTVKDYHLQICQEASAPYPLNFIRMLELDVNYQPEERDQVRICKGHKKSDHKTWKSDAKAWCEKRKERLSQDPLIKSYSVDYDGSMVKGYTVKAHWKHHNNASVCDHYFLEEQLIKAEHFEESNERWVCDQDNISSVFRNPDCTLMEKVCLDSSPKNINGKEIQKQCWKEKLSFLCHFPKTKTCSFLRDRNCSEVSRKCLQESAYGCALWEITYKCFGKVIRQTSPTQIETGIYGLVGNSWGADYEPSQSFPAVFTKMQVFQEVKKELETADAPDASKIELFKGKKYECSKSVADKMLYDCCFSYGGLAKDLQLSQCSAEEIELGTLREKELCHYVGDYSEEFLDLWKSRDVHVFCCFPTKLARIFQEEAHDQLGLGWGKAKEPICNGLSIEDISKIDFAKLDLSTIYDKKIQDFETKFQEKLENLNGNWKTDDLKERQFEKMRQY